MSFRTRLTLFFLLIVVLPIVALGVVVTQVASDSATGKTDAQLGSDLDVGLQLYRERVNEAEQVAESLARDLLLASGATRETLERLAAERGLETLEFESPEGEALSVGERPPVAGASVEISRDGTSAGRLTASLTSASSFLDRVRGTTGEDAVLVTRSRTLARTVSIEATALPQGGEGADVAVEGEEQRVAVTRLPGDGELRLALFTEAAEAGFLASSPAIAVALIAFVAIALLAVAFLTRTLQGQIGAMLDAARRIGAGDFSSRVPIVGGDEMAGLAREFNKMSERLSTQLSQLRRQRDEIERSVHRIGEAFASGLDRSALISIVVETAVAACRADYGLLVLSGHVGAEAEAGRPNETLREVALAAEYRATRAAEGLFEASQDGTFALASPLGQDSAGEPLGVISLARADRAFTKDESDVFCYLVGQAEASVENVALHELFSEQAATDELTGLANNRGFRETIEREAARAARFRHYVSLLILDLDDFKLVNDTYGHPQGDEVLRAVGRILASQSREVDTPARYGGEEFVVALPETDRDGAFEFGERFRERIAAAPIPLVEGSGFIHVTASLGAATMPGPAHDVEALFAAADSALYDAKRSGKNRVMQAPDLTVADRVAGDLG